MKHSLKVTLILLSMFFITQLIGIAVIHLYAPEVKEVVQTNGEILNVTSYNLPYGTNPPEGITPNYSLFSIIFAIVFAVFLMFILMKIRAELFLRLWFFFVITLAIGITINSFILGMKNSALIAIIVALPLSFFKVFNRNIIIHNLTELMIYPGIAAIFVPLLNVWTISILLVLISIYDVYAVWHAGFMQKMAKYQIQHLKVFSGFFVPYIGRKEKELITKLSKSKSKSKKKNFKINVAILGGGDVVFPIMLAGVVLRSFGLIEALIITLGATLALATLFYYSKKGKFYPAMPFISAGCFLALFISLIYHYVL